VDSLVNTNEFAQPELHNSKTPEVRAKVMDVVSMAGHGHGHGPCKSDYLFDGYEEYAALLSRFTSSGGFRKQDLTTFIDTVIDDYLSPYTLKNKLGVQYKLSLLTVSWPERDLLSREYLKKLSRENRGGRFWRAIHI
jgi:hypothetical protein